MKKFEQLAANKNNEKWENIISRQHELYSRGNDIRSEFGRDYTRIIFCNAYKRLKHKTQVFFSPENDHICTRIEHVTHVESISYTIARYLGLNTELTKAISVGHDLGHSPFGHQGEKVLNKICNTDIDDSFWHEKNGLFFVDNIELLDDIDNFKQNLDLTYAVRDGIISHCGEINENSLFPRNDYISLSNYSKPNEFAPYTWEACVVKIADKISYLCRDLEDALTLGIIENNLDEIHNFLNIDKNKPINNTIIINNLICDLCENSNPNNGLMFSNEALTLMNKLKEFNYKNIYFSPKLQHCIKYFETIITEIYNTLKNAYSGENTLQNLEKMHLEYPILSSRFLGFVHNYFDLGKREELKLKNKIVFDIANPIDYYKSIICFISGMTDNFAIDVYNEIISF